MFNLLHFQRFTNRCASLLISFLALSNYTFTQSSTISTGCAPLQVTFNAPVGSSSYYWDFNDGASSNLQNPTNTFVSPGTYEVEFSENVGGPVLGTVTITVYPKPNPQYIANSPLKGCVPLNINLSADVSLPTGIIVNGYSWTFGEGSGANGQNVNFTYTSSGTYTVSLGITTNTPSCDNTSTFTNVIGVSNPTANFLTDPSPAVSCTAPLNVVFTDGSSSVLPLSYAWDFGNGNTSTSVSPPVQNYAGDGNYTATLTITDTNNCVKTTSKPITVGVPTASFDIPDTICINKMVQFQNNSSAGNYSWNFGPAAIPAFSGSNSPFVYFNSEGNQSVTLTVSGQGGLCSDDTTKIIYVENPTVTIIATPNPQCDTNVVLTYTVSTTSSIVSYNWVFDDGDTSTSANPTHEYHISDTAYALRGNKVLSGTLIVETSGGCTILQNFKDTVYLVYARFMPDLYQGCVPLSVNFSDSSHSEFDINNYFYDYGDGSTMSYPTNTNLTSHTYNTPGEYPVVMTATNSLGCTDISDTIWIQVGEPLPLDFTANQTTICPGDSISFTNISASQSLIDGWNYSSDGELLSGCFGDPDGNFVFDDTVGVFDITLSAYYNGCLSTTTKSDFITINGPIAKFNYIYNCSDTMDLQLINQSMGYTGVQWDFGDGNSSNVVDTTYTYNNTGVYQIVLTASNNSSGCPVSVDTAEIQIRHIEAAFLADSLYCGGTPYPFNAGASSDVFEDCYRGYKWIFSDPDIRPITTDNPYENISFENSGLQTLSLIVTDFNGCTDTLTHDFSVYNVIADYILQDNVICTPDTLDFNSLSISDTIIDTWSWSFGDGGVSADENATHIYTGTPSSPYEITLTVTDVFGCQDESTQTLNFYKPVSTVSTIPVLGHACTESPILFNATDYTSQGSNLAFQWDFGDGTVASGQSTSHAYYSDTTAFVWLYYEENATGCRDSVSYMVDIQGYPEADFSSDVDNLGALCSPQAINFSNQSISTSPITSTQWTFSNGLAATSANPVFVFTEGTYSATMIVRTSYGCSDTITKSFNVINPSGDFVMDTSLVCLGDDIQFTIIDTMDVGGYSWDFGDGIFIDDVSPVTHSYLFLPPSGQTNAKLTVYGVGGVCPSTIEKPVLIRDVRAFFDRNDDLDTALCLGEDLTLTNNSLNSDGFQWIFGDGTTGSNALGSFSHTFSYADTFSISLSVYNTQFGCRDTIRKDVIVYEVPEIKAIGDTVCFGDIAQLMVEGDQPYFTYSWSPSAFLNNDTIYNPTADLESSTDLSVVVLDTITKCSVSEDASVIVIQPLQSVYFDTTIVVGDSIPLPIDNLDGFVTFIWSPDSALSCLDCSYPWHQGLEDITYTLIMEDILGCSTAEGIFNIHIFPETFLDLPTTFTPNGDGVNDIIYLKGWGIKEVAYFKIFNRWGELVFETNDIDIGWDGYYKGVLQNNDTYTYKAMVTTWRNEEIEDAGHINLMR